ncbi:YdcF family protein [uncultured Clostridium sp.]|uniref:YdcF family protein n=1 Tax=uncultured Clostridium sp. TaxID=59620 RepID=UPI002631C1C6|nr:YdcF family protein [uncultured Clostridium sp.]
MRVIDDITNFIFVEDKPVEADIIFIPGASKYEISEKASELYIKGFAKKIMPAGKYSSKNNRFISENTKGTRYEGIYETDCEFCKKVLIDNGVAKEDIIEEDESTNTKENAFFSQRILEKEKIKVKKAIICCQAFHARRVLMTYSWAFPEVKFYIVPVNTQGISKGNWFENEYGISRVLGEVKKCGTYFDEYLKGAIKK